MKTLVTKCIRFYQMISRAFPATPVFLGSFSGCRSWPTCSDYAVEAIQRHGVWKGGLKSIHRVARCHPL